MLKLLLLCIGTLFTDICLSQTGENVATAGGKDSIYIGTKKVPLIVSARLYLKIYPNPAKNKISLLVTGFKPGMVTVKILDEKGNLRSNDNRLLTTTDDEIIMFLQLHAGIYFVAISQQNKTIRKKLMVY